MKDSGVAWIGEIPKGWEISRIKDVLFIKTGTTPKGYDEVNNEEDKVYWFTPSDITDECNELDKSERTLLKIVIDKENIRLYPKGSLIFVGIGATAGKLGFSLVEGYSNQQITALIPKENAFGKYLYYYMIVDRKRIKDNAFYTTLPIINNSYLSQIKIILPLLSEQQTIANYLDEKCAEIDNLISLLEEMIGELKAYKQSVITEAVCKGLNKNVPMKESGIEWIGEIPRDWGVCRLKNHIIFNPKHTNEKGLCNDDIVSFMPMECLRTGNIEPKSTNYQIAQAYTPFENGDIVMAKVTPCFENGNIAIACCLLNGYGFGSSEIFVFRCNSKLSNTFLYYYLQSHFVKAIGISSMTGTGGLKRVNPKVLINIQLLFPPLSEQQSIANYLDEKCGNIEGLIAIKQAKIDELKEFKKSLIYEYVTGKKSVI